MCNICIVGLLYLSFKYTVVAYHDNIMRLYTLNISMIKWVCTYDVTTKNLDRYLVQRVADDLHVHLVNVLLGDAVDKVGRQGRVDQHGVVELGGRRRDVDRLHLLERAQRVTLGDELRDGALVQRAHDQQHDIVDHVRVSGFIAY